MRRLTPWIMLALLLSACGSTPVRVPNPLPRISPEFALQRLWQVDIGVGVENRYLKLTPAVDGQTLYALDHMGRLQALELASGKRLWQQHLPMEVSAGIALGGGQLFVASPDGTVLALSSKDGSILWRGLVSSEVLAPPVYTGASVLVHSTDGKLFALDSNSGRIQWTYDRSVPVLSLRGTSHPVVHQGTVFETFSSGRLAIIQLADGKVLFERPLGIASGRSDLARMNDADAGPLLDNDVVYVATYQGNMLALNLRNGAQVWSRKLSVFQPMVKDEQLLYVVDADDTVWALDKRSGSPVWKQDALYARQLSAPVLSGDYLLVGDFEGNVHVLSRQDGHFVSRYHSRITEHRIDKTQGGLQVSHPLNKLAILATPLVVEDKLITYSRNGRLTALQLPKTRQ